MAPMGVNPRSRDRARRRNKAANRP